MGDTLIRTTARFQEAQEPIKQRPIIQIEGNALPNTIRSSIESGRDNPFRPDGEIYKSADPIVDYYKYGPNQSRAHSPTDSQLLLNGSRGSGQVESNNKRKNKKKRARGEEEVTGDEPKKSCWRKWLCCCCCKSRCCAKKASTEGDNEADDGDKTRLGATESTRPTETTGTAKEKQTKTLILRYADDNSIINGQPQVTETKRSPIEFIAGDNNDQQQAGTIDGEVIESQAHKEKEMSTDPSTQEKSSANKISNKSSRFQKKYIATVVEPVTFRI